MSDDRGSILVVDDVYSNIILLRAILKNHYEVFEAIDGDEAVRLAKEKKPTLVLLDVMMPDVDGFTVCKRLKSDPETAEIAVIFISAKNTSGDIVKGFEVGAVDYITKPFCKAEVFARVETHISLNLTKRQLKESDDRYATLVANLKDGVFLWSPEDNIHFSNDAFADMLNLSKEELLGIRVENLLDEGDIQTASKALFETAESRKTSLGEYNVKMLKKGGGYIHTSWLPCFVPYLGEMVVLVTVRDMTDRMNLEREMSQHQKMEALGHLTSGIAHDFNNILALINGYSELLLLELEPDSGLREKISIIHEAGKSAVSLTKGLLSFGKKKSVELVPVDLASEIKSVKSFLAKGLPRNIALCVDVPKDRISVMADTGMFQQVLVNLCLNARDAMPDGGKLIITLDVETIVELPVTAPSEALIGDYALIMVEDTGSGIPDTIINNIFDPFFTTKCDGKGSGLGLAMVDRIVRNHKGWLNIDSEEGRGSLFRIFIPQADVEVQDDDRLLLKRYKHNFRESLKRVIVADDDRVQLSMMQYFLEREGYRVVLAHDGEDALKVIEENSGEFDLAILDEVMPAKMGSECCSIIKDRWPEMKVMMISGAGNVPLVGDVMLAKPFTVKDLLINLDKIADKKPTI